MQSVEVMFGGKMLWCFKRYNMKHFCTKMSKYDWTSLLRDALSSSQMSPTNHIQDKNAFHLITSTSGRESECRRKMTINYCEQNIPRMYTSLLAPKTCRIDFPRQWWLFNNQGDNSHDPTLLKVCLNLENQSGRNDLLCILHIPCHLSVIWSKVWQLNIIEG